MWRFGYGGSKSSRWFGGILVGYLVGVNVVCSGREWDWFVFEDGVGIFIIIVIVFFFVLFVVYFVEFVEFYDYELIVWGFVWVGLSIGNGVYGGWVGFVVVVEGVFDDVEGKIRLGSVEVVKYFVGCWIGGEGLFRFEFVFVDDEGVLINFYCFWRFC